VFLLQAAGAKASREKNVIGVPRRNQRVPGREGPYTGEAQARAGTLEGMQNLC
jgi:hypothetical protein